MTATDVGTPQAVLDTVGLLAPQIAGRAAEVEADRRVPRDLLDELIRAGCFRLLMPTSHGGLGADLLATMRVLDTLAQADASVAWTVMIGGGAWCDLLGLPRATFDAIFARPDVIVAGVFAPSGSIEPVDHGFRVRGRWAFASGCEHADVLYGNCVEGIVDGVPRLRTAVFTPVDVVIEDTWTAVGLRGTGSHHFRVEGLTVAPDRTTRPFDDPRCLDEPIARIPAPTLLAPLIATVAVGIAQGALDDLLALAADKVPLLDRGPLAAGPLFQADLAEADTGVRAARALLSDVAGSTWTAAVDGTPFAPEHRARVRAAATWATDRAVAVVETAYRWGGSDAVHAASPLQRRLRDVHTLAQHFLVKRDVLTTAGAVLAGRGLDVAIF